MQSATSPKVAEDSVPDTIPYPVQLELTVTDPEVVSKLRARREGRERDEYALGALRLGVLALCQASGQIDANALKHEGERLLGNVQLALSEHRTNLDRTLVGTLKDYFDPGERPVQRAGAAAAEEGRGAGDPALPQGHGGGLGDVPGSFRSRRQGQPALPPPVARRVQRVPEGAARRRVHGTGRPADAGLAGVLAGQQGGRAVAAGRGADRQQRQAPH